MAGRVADFIELGELMCRDALAREESTGCHFREEHQTPEGEAKRDDERFCHVAVWEYAGPDAPPARHEEPLVFDNVHLTPRNYAAWISPSRSGGRRTRAPRGGSSPIAPPASPRTCPSSRCSTS